MMATLAGATLGLFFPRHARWGNVSRAKWQEALANPASVRLAPPTEGGERVIKPRAWNDLGIAIEGEHIVTRLNGVQIVDCYEPIPKFEDGAIGPLLHAGGGAKVHRKDILVQELGE
jgi:hypothetical protein